MEITRERTLTLCRMAYDGARDDGGRAFVSAMQEAYVTIWREIDKQESGKNAQEQKNKIDELLKMERVRMQEQLEQELAEKLQNAVHVSENENKVKSKNGVPPSTP